MSRSVLVQDGVVANVAVGAPAGYVALSAEDVSAGVGIGWSYDGSTFSAPTPPADTRTDAERAAATVLAPATFFPALRTALAFSADGSLTPPSATESAKSWLIAWLQSEHTHIQTHIDADPETTSELATLLAADNATAQAIVTLMLDRIDAATVIEGSDPALDALGARLGLSPAQIDAVFIAASGAATDTAIATDVAAALTALQ